MRAIATAFTPSFSGQAERRSALLALAVMTFAAIWLAAMPHAGATDTGAQHMRFDNGNIDNVVTLGVDKSLVVDLPRDAKDVLVSNPAKADAVMRTSRRAYVIGLEVGQTNIFFFDAAGQQILNLELVIERDLAGLRAMLRRLLPEAEITVDAINENVVLTGSVANPAIAGRAADIAARFAGEKEKVLNMLAVQGQDQVMLQVTVAEIERSAIKQFGVDINAAISAGKTTYNIVTGNPFSITGSPLSPTAFSGLFNDGQTSVQGVVRALEQQGLLKTLAEPTLTAVSGEAASFLAGGEFPIPVGLDDNQVTIEYKPFGVSLSFTPVVMSEGRISMRIETEVSETTTDGAFSLNAGGTAGFVIPGIKARRANTTVELPSGGSLVMAGLIKEDMRRSVDGVPGVKDLPILGALFRSQEFQNSETEMVVIVTPLVVKPTSRANLALPTDGLAAPSDLRAVLLGQINEIYGVEGARPAGTYQGQYGYIIK